MKKHFKDQGAIILDFVKSSEEYGIHSIDVLTMTKPDGSI